MVGRYSLRPRKNRPAPTPPSPPSSPKPRRRTKRRTKKSQSSKSSANVQQPEQLDDNSISQLNDDIVTNAKNAESDVVQHTNVVDTSPQQVVEENVENHDAEMPDEHQLMELSEPDHDDDYDDEEEDKEAEAAADAEFEAAAIAEAEKRRDADFVPVEEDEEDEEEQAEFDEVPSSPGEWDLSPPPSPQQQKRKKKVTKKAKTKSKKKSGKAAAGPTADDATVERLFRSLDMSNNGRIRGIDIQRVADDHGQFYSQDELRDMVRFWDTSGTSTVDLATFRVLVRDAGL